MFKTRSTCAWFLEYLHPILFLKLNREPLGSSISSCLLCSFLVSTVFPWMQIYNFPCFTFYYSIYQAFTRDNTPEIASTTLPEYTRYMWCLASLPGWLWTSWLSVGHRCWHDNISDNIAQLALLAGFGAFAWVRAHSQVITECMRVRTNILEHYPDHVQLWPALRLSR